MGIHNITVHSAHQRNLKNIDMEIPRDALTVDAAGLSRSR